MLIPIMNNASFYLCSWENYYAFKLTLKSTHLIKKVQNKCDSLHILHTCFKFQQPVVKWKFIQKLFALNWIYIWRGGSVKIAQHYPVGLSVRRHSTTHMHSLTSRRSLEKLRRPALMFLLSKQFSSYSNVFIFCIWQRNYIAWKCC